MENQEETTKAFLKPNGPIILTGEFELEQEDGSITKEKRVALCRCAASGKMPYCDGSHSRIGFQSK
ncbi:MAG: CDGSH iron-sulfur domain-containing protein [Chitinophagales bacterium]